MLISEIWQLSSEALAIGWDELYDDNSTPGYVFYGLAPLGTAHSAAAWFITCSLLGADGSPSAIRYYPYNQVWTTRASVLSLPVGP